MHAHVHQPSPWIARFAHLVRAGGTVLDVAAGSGRHARLFAARGCRVVAVDRDAGALDSLRGEQNVTCETADLENGGWPFTRRQFDALVVTNYLHRPLLPHLAASLAPDGVLLYETFAAGNGRYGRPSNPDFLLGPAELLDVFAPVTTVVAFEQGDVQGAAPAVVQRLAAVGRGRPWPPVLVSSGG